MFGWRCRRRRWWWYFIVFVDFKWLVFWVWKRIRRSYPLNFWIEKQRSSSTFSSVCVYTALAGVFYGNKSHSSKEEFNSAFHWTWEIPYFLSYFSIFFQDYRSNTSIRKTNIRISGCQMCAKWQKQWKILANESICNRFCKPIIAYIFFFRCTRRRRRRQCKIKHRYAAINKWHWLISSIFHIVTRALV